MATKSETNNDTTIAVPSKVFVSTTIKAKGKPEKTDAKEEIIEIHKFVTEPAKATVSIPLKLSMDYQSLGIEVGVTIPCYAEELDKGIDKAYQTALKKVMDKIPELQNTLVELTGSKRGR